MTLPKFNMEPMDPQYLSTFDVAFGDSEVLTKQLTGIDLCDGHATFNVNVVGGLAQPIHEIMNRENRYDVLVKLTNKRNEVTMVLIVKGLVFNIQDMTDAVIRQMRLHYGSQEIMDEIQLSWTCDRIDIVSINEQEND